MYRNNLCVYDLLTNTSTQYTDNGEDNIIYNGVPDWVYEGIYISCIHVDKHAGSDGWCIMCRGSVVN